MSYKRINRNDFQITLTDKYTSENFKEDMKSIFDSFEIPKNKEIQINIIGKSEVCHRILDNTDINIRWRRKSKELRKFGDIEYGHIYLFGMPVYLMCRSDCSFKYITINFILRDKETW